MTVCGPQVNDVVEPDFVDFLYRVVPLVATDENDVAVRDTNRAKASRGVASPGDILMFCRG
jgi:hypothetical protein